METKENIKLKNLLKKVLENKGFEYSFDDNTYGNDGKYTFEYHMIVNYVRGVGSGSVADVSVIIDDIIMNGESVYLGWAEIGYSENVWYIYDLHDHLNNEFFNVFPFSIYPTFYGHDEKRDPINENIDGSLKIKNLLKKVLENQEFEISFELGEQDFDITFVLDELIMESMVGKYLIKFYINVGDVTGEGSNAVASVDVIIVSIEKDGEDFYDNWVDHDYSEYAWYIDEFTYKLRDELLSNFPFKIHPTFYGHDEQRKS